MKDLVLRALNMEDGEEINAAFKVQGWNKPISTYQQYYSYQEEGLRDIILAEYKKEFAGYLTILWESYYPPFKEQGIPEIVDFNVLKKFQRKGIGTALMDEAETRISKRSRVAGIGFGVTKDYGAAQILYIKRGYIPDGNGLINNTQLVQNEEQVTIGDNLVFCLTKQLVSG